MGRYKASGIARGDLLQDPRATAFMEKGEFNSHGLLFR
jgi:hypothetical protein